MGVYILINVIVLFCLNMLFLLLGSFLNALVILCFWKSSHLRKKLCHFTILVLSCIDLSCVIVIHPLIILSILAWHFQDSALRQKLENLKPLTSTLYSLSFYALITMNLERYIAIKYPLYHKTSMTKAKLMLVFATLFLLAVILRVLSAIELIPPQMPSSITFIVLLSIMLLINCKMYIITKRTRQMNIRHGAGNKMQNKRENSQSNDTAQEKHDQSREESNKLHGKSDKLHEESNKLHEKSNKLHEESNKLYMESNKLHEKSNKLHEETIKLHEKTGKLHVESSKLHKESNKSGDESNKLQEKSNKLDESRNELQEKNGKLYQKSDKHDAKSNKINEKGDSLQKNKHKKRNKLPMLRLQNVSTCILAVACFTVCSLPGMIFNALNMSMGAEWFGANNFKLTLLWVQTFITMNSSFNTLVFFWKNKILRKEGKQAFKKFRKTSLSR